MSEGAPPPRPPQIIRLVARAGSVSTPPASSPASPLPAGPASAPPAPPPALPGPPAPRPQTPTTPAIRIKPIGGVGSAPGQPPSASSVGSSGSSRGGTPTRGRPRGPRRGSVRGKLNRGAVIGTARASFPSDLASEAPATPVPPGRGRPPGDGSRGGRPKGPKAAGPQDGNAGGDGGIGALPGEAGAEAEEEEEEEDDEYDDGDNQDITELLQRDALQKKLMFSSLTEDQMQRIEAYRRLKLPEKVITAAMNGSIPGRISKNIELVVAGAAKVYAADVITYAQQVKADWGEEGPLRPEHLREGLRRYRLDQKDALPQYASKPNPYLNL